MWATAGARAGDFLEVRSVGLGDPSAGNPWSPGGGLGRGQVLKRPNLTGDAGLLWPGRVATRGAWEGIPLAAPAAHSPASPVPSRLITSPKHRPINHGVEMDSVK